MRNLDVPVFRHSGIALGHPELNLHRAARSIEHAVELDQEAVAHGLENAPVVSGDGGIEEFPPMGFHRAESALFVGLHQAAVANDIGRQDGGQAPFDLFFAHAFPRIYRAILDELPRTA